LHFFISASIRQSYVLSTIVSKGLRSISFRLHPVLKKISSPAE
jgi:hypothetical protein